MDVLGWIGIPLFCGVLIIGWWYADRSDRASRHRVGQAVGVAEWTGHGWVDRPARTAAVPGTATESRVRRMVRRGLTAQVLIGIAVGAFVLATETRWGSPAHFLPWGLLVVLLLALLLAMLPGGRGVMPARMLAILVLGVSLYGVVEHVLANYAAGPADPTVGRVWESIPVFTRWWLAATKGVGSAPPLAPAALGQIALGLLLITVTAPRGRHSDRL